MSERGKDGRSIQGREGDRERTGRTGGEEGEMEGGRESREGRRHSYF